MIRQRSEEFPGYGGTREVNAVDKRLRAEEVGGVYSRVGRSPSPSPHVATVSRASRVRSELQAILESFCCLDASALYGPGFHHGGGGECSIAAQAQEEQALRDVFSFTTMSPHSTMGGASQEKPSQLLVLLEVTSVCDQVWRAGTCAEGSGEEGAYTNRRRSYPYDDTGYNPYDLLLPVANASNTNATGRSSSIARSVSSGGASPYGRAQQPLSSLSQEEAHFAPIHQHHQQYEDEMPSAASAALLQKRTMQPLTSHILMTLGGFARTECGGFIHLRHPEGRGGNADVLVPTTVLEAQYFVRPATSSNAMSALHPNSFTCMCVLYAACRQLLCERGHAGLVARHCRMTPLSIFLGNADGFGWRDDQNTVEACQRVITASAYECTRLQQDACFLLWDAMLTDAGLPSIERSLHHTAGDNMYHAFTSHFCYGAGIAALCIQSTLSTAMACGVGVASMTAAPSVLMGNTNNSGPPYAIPHSSLVNSTSSLPFSMSSSASHTPGPQLPLVSPPHVLLKARLACGCVLVVMPAGIDGPVVASFFVNRAVWDEHDVAGGGEGGVGVGGVNFSASAFTPNSFSNAIPFESLSEKSVRYLWWYMHQMCLATFPTDRIRIVCSIGEVLLPSQVSVLPSQKREMPRLSTIKAMCCEGYSVEGSGGMVGGANVGPKKFRFICVGGGSSSSVSAPPMPPMRFVDL